MKSTPKPSDTLQLIKMVIDKISLQHTPSKFQLEIEKQIPELVAYVKAKDLLYIDPSKPLVVRKEPAYIELQEHQFRHQVLTIKMLILIIM
jgi:hypothetical protein